MTKFTLTFALAVALLVVLVTEAHPQGNSGSGRRDNAPGRAQPTTTASAPVEVAGEAAAATPSAPVDQVATSTAPASQNIKANVAETTAANATATEVTNTEVTTTEVTTLEVTTTKVTTPVEGAPELP